MVYISKFVLFIKDCAKLQRLLIRILIFVLTCSFSFSSLSSYSAEEILGKDNFELLFSQKKIQSNEFKPTEAKLFLLPKTQLAKRIAELWTSSEDVPSLVGENVYLIEKDNIDLDEASVILRSVSKMQGMQYYSNGEKRWTTLYHDAYCVSGPTEKTKIPDNTTGSANGVIQYCLLNDNSLGKTNYKVSYFQTENEISMQLENTTSVTYGPIKAVKPKNLHINLVMTICDDFIVVYMNVKANFLSLGFLEKRMQRSLLARLDAIFNWFSEEISHV